MKGSLYYLGTTFILSTPEGKGRPQGINHAGFITVSTDNVSPTMFIILFWIITNDLLIVGPYISGFSCIYSASGHTEALILARGGSKGIILKNLQTVGGVSLLARAIRTTKLAGLRVTVSTDHPLIALEALKS